MVGGRIGAREHRLDDPCTKAIKTFNETYFKLIFFFSDIMHQVSRVMTWTLLVVGTLLLAVTTEAAPSPR